MPLDEELLKKIQKLSKDKLYRDIITSLTDEVLLQNDSDLLYAELAQAAYFFGNHELCDKSVELALKKNPGNAKACFYKATRLSDLGKDEEAILEFKKAISADPTYANAHHDLGVVYERLGRNDDAIESYKNALKHNDNLSLSYYGLGNTYLKEGKNDEALEAFKNAIQRNEEDPNPYVGIGNIYLNSEKNYEEAIDWYTKAIERRSFYDTPYYNIGLANYELKKYDEALKYYSKYLDVTSDPPDDFFRRTAQDRIVEISKLVNTNPDLVDPVKKNTEEIKKLLSYLDGGVTHYTSFSAAKALIIEESPFRLSEGAFLNDASEGTELYRHLDPLKKPLLIEKEEDKQHENDTDVMPFAQKPFIGSFVHDNKDNDLTLWRMYSKENKEDAKGCSITIDIKKLIENLKKKFTSDGRVTISDKIDKEFRFYHVAYATKDPDRPFIIPGEKDEDQRELHEKELKKCMHDLADSIKAYNNAASVKEDYQSFIQIKEYLNEIAFLFKSSAYQYENELRLVVKGDGFEKNVVPEKGKDAQTPRVYIELVNIIPLIKKITLGPKVDMKDEWASVFHYKLMKDYKPSIDSKEDEQPKVRISYLKFK